MNDYCVNLNLDINPLMDGVSFKDVQDGEKYWTFVNLKYINPELKKLFESLGLQIVMAALFAQNGKDISEIHLDGLGVGDVTKINWTSTVNHNMMWYKVKEADLSKKMINIHEDEQSKLKRPYIPFDDDEVIEVYRSPLGNPSIIQAGIPHNVENYGGVRQSLSIVLIENRKPVPMSRAKEIFSKYIIEVDKL